MIENKITLASNSVSVIVDIDIESIERSKGLEDEASVINYYYYDK